MIKIDIKNVTNLVFKINILKIASLYCRKVEMPYSWHILKPNLTSSQDQILPPGEVNWEALEFYPDDNPCFFVEPMQGTLQPDGIHEFVVTFAPHQVILLLIMPFKFILMFNCLTSQIAENFFTVEHHQFYFYIG